LEEKADLNGETVRCGKLAKTGASADQTQGQIPAAQPTLSTFSTAIGDSPAPIAESGQEFPGQLCREVPKRYLSSVNSLSGTGCYKFLRHVPYYFLSVVTYPSAFFTVCYFPF
jgi:hypothetical protein